MSNKAEGLRDDFDAWYAKQKGTYGGYERTLAWEAWTAAQASQEKRAVPEATYEGDLYISESNSDFELFILDEKLYDKRYRVLFYRIGDKAGEE